MCMKTMEYYLNKLPDSSITYTLPAYAVVGFEEIKGHVFAVIDWRSLVETFPEKHIIFTNVKPVPGNRLFLCTVLAVCTDDEVMQLQETLIDEGYRATALRTTNKYNGAEVL